MILSAVIFMSLLAASATGSAIKGRNEEYPVKGGRPPLAPVEYQRQEQYEHREAYQAKGHEAQAAPAPEQAKLADSELYQQREEKQQQQQQFYEAQPQLRKPASAPSKTEERAEEQTKLTQLPEQTRYEDYQQQREESPKQEQVKQQQQQQQYEKQHFYEARPQVREEVVAVPVAAAAVLTRAQAKGESAYAKADERREEQVQYAQAEQTKLEELPARADEAKYGQKFEAQQAVELTRQDYEQRRFEEQAEQRAEEQVAQVRVEEGQLKGGTRAPGAEAEPYAFDYSVEGSSRRESGDTRGVVRGQYTLQNPDGSQRIVDYVADQDGFRAQVQTNEFGTENQQPANVALRSSQPSAEGITLRLEGKTRELVPVQPQYVAAVKSAAPAQQPIVQVVEAVRARPYEETRAYKGAPALAPAPAPLPLPAPAPIPALAPAPALAAPVKGEAQLELRAPVVQEHAPYKAEEATGAAPLQQPQQRPIEPIKSAELKAAPRAPVKTGAILARASGFESATAHRPVIRSAPLHAAAAPVPLVRQVPLQPVLRPVPVVRHQLLSPLRGSHQHPHQHQLQHQHHHVQAVPVGVLRTHSSHHLAHLPAGGIPLRRELPHNPRISFYANGDSDEHSAGFEHPADLI